MISRLHDNVESWASAALNLSWSATSSQDVPSSYSPHVKERWLDQLETGPNAPANDGSAWQHVRALATSVSPVPPTLYRDGKKLVQDVYASNLEKLTAVTLPLAPTLESVVGPSKMAGADSRGESDKAAAKAVDDEHGRGSEAEAAGAGEGQADRTAALERQGTMLLDCIRLASELSQSAASCAGVLAIAGSRDPPSTVASELALESLRNTWSASVTTLGIGLSGVRVVDVLIDGPADRSGLIEVGDDILEVDGARVTSGTINRYLVGCDVPQTLVALTVRKTDGREVGVHIKRMASADIAWKRCMFEALGMLVAAAESRGGTQDAAAAQSAISLWSAGLKQSAAYDRAVEAGLVRVQSDMTRLSSALVHRLERMNDLGLDSLTKLHDVWKLEQDVRAWQTSVQYRHAFRLQQRRRSLLLLCAWTEWQWVRVGLWVQQEEASMEDKLRGMESRLVVLQAQHQQALDGEQEWKARSIAGRIFDKWHGLQIRSRTRVRGRALLWQRRMAAAVRHAWLAWLRYVCMARMMCGG